MTGISEEAPSLALQQAQLGELYDDILTHYGQRVGLRHARKHLGWALDVAARAAAAPSDLLKTWRQKILTTEIPMQVQRLIPDAYASFAESAA